MGESAIVYIILFLVTFIIAGAFLYIYYFKESFLNETITTPYCECAAGQPLFNSIISKFSGIGINVTQVTQQTGSDQQLYLINTIPINANSVAGSVYAIDNNNRLTTVVKNMNDSNQYWTITPYGTANNLINIVEPYIQKVSGVRFALQYEHGNLSIRPFEANFKAQYWLTSLTVFNVGVPVVVVNPASIYTPEFAQVGNFTPGSGISTTLDAQNNQQVNNVINLIQAGVQQYMTQLNEQTNGTGTTSSSSLGNSGNPLNISVNLNNDKGKDSVSAFTNISNTTGTASSNVLDVIGLLNAYENAQNPIADDYTLYRESDLKKALHHASSMHTPDVRDYVSKTISTCNCKL
uniref:Uncharacterized protein n=1 Tax=viral metagenome TaxID=1070528 RepID=A0A6C0HN61_9ZZZZ